MNWIIVLAVLVVVGFLLDREIYFYEGAHLGPRVQSWLYDRWSKKYDEGKRASQLRDDEMLAQPLLEVLQDVPQPFVLDFAAGTGRLSLALLSCPEFKGRIIALDLSQGMLEKAALKLRGYLKPLSEPPRIEFLRHHSLPLPFPDAAFDVVGALEVLELFPGMDEPLHEFARVLRPGGILLTSRGTEQSGRTAKVKSENGFASILERIGFTNIWVTRWWKLFDRVIALKNGSSSPAEVRSLSDTMCCAACNHTQWQKQSDQWKCLQCGKEVMLTKEGIVLG